jgi:hypothetical protein
MMEETREAKNYLKHLEGTQHSRKVVPPPSEIAPGPFFRFWSFFPKTFSLFWNNPWNCRKVGPRDFLCTRFGCRFGRRLFRK